MRGHLLRFAIGGAVFLAILALASAFVFVPFLVIGIVGVLAAYGIGDMVVNAMNGDVGNVIPPPPPPDRG